LRISGSLQSSPRSVALRRARAPLEQQKRRAATLIQSFVTARGGIPSHADYLQTQEDEHGIGVDVPNE
jgi:hypothetical protein